MFNINIVKNYLVIEKINTGKKNEEINFLINLSSRPDFYIFENSLICETSARKILITKNKNEGLVILGEITKLLRKLRILSFLIKTIILLLFFLTLYMYLFSIKSPTIDTKIIKSGTSDSVLIPNKNSSTSASALIQNKNSDNYTSKNTFLNNNQTIEKTLSSNLASAKNKKYFTIPLSTGHEKTIYVFSDPLCPSCAQLEPILNKLSSQFNIEIFPVTLIGKEKSVNKIIPVLCSTYGEERAEQWNSIFNIDLAFKNKINNSTNNNECNVDVIKKFIAVNDFAFNKYNFTGTPYLIGDDGIEISLKQIKDLLNNL